MRVFNKISFLITICLFCYSCEGLIKKSSNANNDTLISSTATIKQDTSANCTLHPLTVSNTLNELSKINSINSTYLVGNDIYMLSNEGKKVLVFNLESREIRVDHKITAIINSVNSKYSDPVCLHFDEDGLFIGFEFGFVKVDKHYQIIYEQKIDILAETYQMFTDGKFIIPDIQTTKVYNYIDGSLIRNINSNWFFTFYKSDSSTYTGAQAIKQLIYQGDSIAVKKKTDFQKSSLITKWPLIDDMYPCFITSKYILWSFFGERKQLVVTDKDLTKTIRVIPLKDFDLTTENQFQMNMNEYSWDFSFDIKGNIIYITHFNKNKLSIYQGCLIQ